MAPVTGRRLWREVCQVGRAGICTLGAPYDTQYGCAHGVCAWSVPGSGRKQESGRGARGVQQEAGQHTNSAADIHVPCWRRQGTQVRASSEVQRSSSGEVKHAQPSAGPSGRAGTMLARVSSCSYLFGAEPGVYVCMQVVVCVCAKSPLTVTAGAPAGNSFRWQPCTTTQ